MQSPGLLALQQPQVAGALFLAPLPPEEAKEAPPPASCLLLLLLLLLMMMMLTIVHPALSFSTSFLGPPDCQRPHRCTEGSAAGFLPPPHTHTHTHTHTHCAFRLRAWTHTHHICEDTPIHTPRRHTYTTHYTCFQRGYCIALKGSNSQDIGNCQLISLF